MKRLNNAMIQKWGQIGSSRFMPWASVVTPELPLGRLLRLSLFQFSVGMAIVLMIGTLNRVMIVELAVPAWLVSVMISLPLLFAPFRAVVGFRSDTHRSVLGWRRLPYLWMGTLLQFGGLAIMPFALIVLSGDTNGPVIIGQIGAGLAFTLVGAGLHTTQTVGLALASDLAPESTRPRVVAFLCGTLLVGMVVSALAFGALLHNFSEIRLIQVTQGAGLATMLINLFALWKQEARDPSRTSMAQSQPSFRQSWARFREAIPVTRHLIAVGLGSMGFSMQDVLLEPYGGQILHLPVAATTALTALLAAGGLTGFVLSARMLGRKIDPYRVAALGTVVGLFAFSAVIFAEPLDSALIFAVGVGLIGFGGGLFAVGTLTASMELADASRSGLVIGAWGAVQASAAGVAIALGGITRDVVGWFAMKGSLGEALTNPATGYSVVYHVEIALLFATLIAIGPLVRNRNFDQSARFGLADPRISSLI
jgi:BCD family chlorophyll transporter-like MFS transporter